MKHQKLINSFIQLSQKGLWGDLSKILAEDFKYENSEIKTNDKHQFLNYIKKTKIPSSFETLHLFEAFEKNKYFHIFASTYDVEKKFLQNCHQVITIDSDLVSGCFLDGQF